jgi:biotin-[acetyl-CoA-carboxylase] ligase BirA-like protein
VLVLTDNVPRSAAIVSPSTAWAPCHIGDLSSGDGALWRALGPSDRLWIADLAVDDDSSFWSRLVIIDEAPESQFDAVRELYRSQQRLEGPVACVALTGRRFHGHRERTWVAERGNLHLSVGFEPRLPAQQVLPALTMLPAVAAVDAVSSVTHGAVRPGIKWVNDVLVDGRKVAGVLTSTQTRQTIVDSAVLGIGLNVAHAPAVPATVFVPEVGCLARCHAGRSVTLAEVSWSLLRELARHLERLRTAGPEQLLHRYRNGSLVLGKPVRIYDETFGERPLDEPWPEPLARGRVERIESDLSLRLEGCREAVTKGRLAFERACRRLGL